MLAIKHPRLRWLYEYWDGKRAGRTMPSRADIDPLDLRFVIGNISLVDVLPGETLRFRFRVHGTRLAERAHCEMTGKMLDEMPEAEFRELSRASFTEVATTRAPLLVQRSRVIDGRPWQYESIMLPLSRDGSVVDMLIGGMIYDDDC